MRLGQMEKFQPAVLAMFAEIVIKVVEKDDWVSIEYEANTLKCKVIR